MALYSETENYGRRKKVNGGQWTKLYLEGLRWVSQDPRRWIFRRLTYHFGVSSPRTDKTSTEMWVEHRVSDRATPASCVKLVYSPSPRREDGTGFCRGKEGRLFTPTVFTLTHFKPIPLHHCLLNICRNVDNSNKNLVTCLLKSLHYLTSWTSLGSLLCHGKGVKYHFFTSVFLWTFERTSQILYLNRSRSPPVYG